MDRRDNAWKINKEIPLSVLVTLILQTVTAVIFIVKMDARIANLEERRQDDKKSMEVLALVPERLLRTEIETANLKVSVGRLEVKIDQLQAQTDKQRLQGHK